MHHGVTVIWSDELHGALFKSVFSGDSRRQRTENVPATHTKYGCWRNPQPDSGLIRSQSPSQMARDHFIDTLLRSSSAHGCGQSQMEL